MKHITFLLCLLAMSCTKKHDEQNLVPSYQTEALMHKYETYLSLAKAQQLAPHGWTYLSCDGLLFTSLYSSVQGSVGVDITAAREASGRWLRRPIETTCMDGESPSSISKDMLMGLMYYIWRTKRLDLAQALVDYGSSKNWVMGEPYPAEISRVLATPSLIGLAYQVLYALGGPDHVERQFPDIYPAGNVGFEAHLQILSILLRGEIHETLATKGLPDSQQTGNSKPPVVDQSGDNTPSPSPSLHLLDISDSMFDRLKEHALRNPNNPLYLAAIALYDSSFNTAIDKLLNGREWPNDRLPTTADYCDEWVTQREDGADWQPCPSTVTTHPAGEWLFAADLVLRRLHP